MSQHRTRRQCTEHTHTQTHKQTETIGVDCSQLAGEQRALFVCVCLYITIDCQFDLILTKRDSRHQLAKWAAAATVLDDCPVHGHEFTARRHQFEVSHRVSVSVWLIDDRGAAKRRRRRREREPVVVPGPEVKSSAASEASWASIGFPLITTRYPLSLSFSTLHCTCLLLDTGCIFPFPPSFREKKTESLLPVQSWMTTIGKGGGRKRGDAALWQWLLLLLLLLPAAGKKVTGLRTLLLSLLPLQPSVLLSLSVCCRWGGRVCTVWRKVVIPVPLIGQPLYRPITYCLFNLTIMASDQRWVSTCPPAQWEEGGKALPLLALH